MFAGHHIDPQRVSPDHGVANKRRHGRIKCQGVRCNMGDVLDISASGMRVRTRIKPPTSERVFAIQIEGVGEPIVVGARCVWVKRVGWFTREVGLVFEAISSESVQGLRRLAQAAAYNEFFSVGGDDQRQAS